MLNSAVIIQFLSDINDSEGLCINGSNLKYLDGKIVYTNLKEIGYPDFLVG